MHKIAILSSPGGTGAGTRHMITACRDGQIEGTKVAVVISNDEHAPALSVAREFNVPAHWIGRHNFGSMLDAEIEMVSVLRKAGVEVVLLMGYIPKIGQAMLEAFPNQILNFHPGPIPQFGGKGMQGILVEQAVMAAGVEFSGSVIHIVDEEYDHGPVLGYWPIRIRPDDTPASVLERCLVTGRRLYVRVVQEYIYRLDHPDEA